MSNCGLTVLALQTVLKHIETAFPNLKVLKLFNNAISDNGVESLSKSLKKRLQKGFPPLLLVDVSLNNISHEGAIYIADMIMASNGTMEVAFGNNSIGGSGVAIIFSAKYWESFSVSNTNLEDSFDDFIAAIESKGYMLRDLEISENNLSPSTLSRLASLYSSIPLASLQNLTINERLRDEGMQVVLSDKVLKKLRNLRKIYLYNCLLSQNGHLTLIHAYSKGYFPHFEEMTIIDSGCVEIRYFASKGMSAGINRVSHKFVNNNDYSAVFAVSLSVSTLTSLSVYGNAKTNVISILNACYQYGFLHNLTTLSLCHCAIPESGFSQFFLSHSSRLISLQLDDITVNPSFSDSMSLDAYRSLYPFPLDSQVSSADVIKENQSSVTHLSLRNTNDCYEILPLTVLPF